MTNTVVFVNGRPRAGKNLAVSFMKQIINEYEDYMASEYSSIQPVIDFSELIGFPISKHELDKKDETLRRYLADMGDALEIRGIRTAMCLKHIETNFYPGSILNSVTFIYTREMKIMNKIEEQILKIYFNNRSNFKFIRLFVDNPRVPVIDSNKADASVIYDSEKYDHRIVNGSTKGVLFDRCEEFVKDHIIDYRLD